MKYSVFISYSRADREFIEPVVELVRALRPDLVFQDKINILPGRKWEVELMNALNDSEMIIIFWCRHSAKSVYVEKEYRYAIYKGKLVLPLLLDGTSLPAALKDYQSINFKHLMRAHGPSIVGSKVKPTEPQKSYAYNGEGPAHRKYREKTMAKSIKELLDNMLPLAAPK